MLDDNDKQWILEHLQAMEDRIVKRMAAMRNRLLTSNPFLDLRGSKLLYEQQTKQKGPDLPPSPGDGS